MADDGQLADLASGGLNAADRGLLSLPGLCFGGGHLLHYSNTCAAMERAGGIEWSVRGPEWVFFAISVRADLLTPPPPSHQFNCNS